MRTTGIIFAATTCLALAASGCGDSKDTDDGGGKTDGSVPLPDGSMPQPDGSPPPTGEASLSFTPTWGKDNGNQLDALWRPSLPYFEEDSALVLMLCQTDDPTCLAPVLTRELTAAERGDEPIQGSFGPEITVSDLPAGSFQLMIFADGSTSRALGYAWDSGFSTTEKAWKGQVSEGDMMLSSTTPAQGKNPAPEPQAITLTDGATEALGKITLSHAHERDVSPPLPAEAGGKLVVAVETGLRFVDLKTYAVEEVVAGSNVYSYQLADATDQAETGVCGLVEGPGSLVYLLYGGGYAYGFDLATRKQLSTFRVTFANAAGSTPCRGRHVNVGGKDYLYVVNSTANPTSPVGEGMWFAEVTALATQAVTATRLTKTDAPLLAHGFGAVEAYDGALYLSQLAPANAGATVAANCPGKVCVYRAPIGAAGEPDLSALDATVLMGPKADYVAAQGTITCLTSGDITMAGLAVAKFQGSGALKDHHLLFVGGCLEVAVIDLDAARAKVDFNAALPGAQGFDATVFGQGFAAFRLSPDGKTLWSVPSYKAPIHFDIRVPGPGDAEHRQTFNRQMALPLSLTSADLPAVDPAYAKGDIDDFEGQLSLGNYSAPADDPGVDLNHAHAVVYQMTWAPSTAGATPQSASIAVGPTFAVTPAALWLRGSGTSGVSGLGKGGNLGAYSLAERRAVMWSHRGDDFYRYWQTGPGGTEEDRFGFDLTPEGAGVLSTYGLLYLP